MPTANVKTPGTWRRYVFGMLIFNGEKGHMHDKDKLRMALWLAMLSRKKIGMGGTKPKFASVCF